MSLPHPVSRVSVSQCETLLGSQQISQIHYLNEAATMAPKKLILNAFVESCSGHQSPGLWAHPDDQSSDFNDIKYWVRLAKLLEAANFHGIFIADVLVSLPFRCLDGPLELTG